MSIGTSSPRILIGRDDLTAALAVVVGSFVVFAGTFVLFAASPAVPVAPVFDVPSVEPAVVVVNMAVGASIMTAGAEMAVTKLEHLLSFSPRSDLSE